MLDDADSAGPQIRAKAIDAKSPVSFERFVYEVRLAVVLRRRRFARAVLARKSATRLQEATRGRGSISARLESGYRRWTSSCAVRQRLDELIRQLKPTHTVVKHFVRAVVRTPWVGFVSPKCFQT